MCHKAAPESEQKDIKAQVYPPTSVPRCPHCMGEGFAWDRVPEACSNIGFLDGHCTAESFARFGDRCTAGVPGFLEALFHRALCTEWFVAAPQGLLGSWRHCSTEPYAPNGLPLHRRSFWVPGGTVPQSLCKERLPLLRKGKRPWQSECVWGTPPYLGPGS